MQLLFEKYRRFVQLFQFPQGQVAEVDNWRSCFMRRLVSYCVLSLGLMLGTAHADMSKTYFGAGLSDGSVEDPFGGEKNLGTLSLNFGYKVHPLFGVELALGSASDDTGSMVSEPLVTFQAAMLRLGYQWDMVGIYALYGTAQMDIDQRFSDRDSGAAVGFGVNLFGNRTTSLNFNVLNLDDGAFKTTTIGFHHYFGGYR